MRPTESGPGRAVVREDESMRAMRSSIDGQAIAIDAGRGVPAGDAFEQRIAAALADALAAMGAKPVVLERGGRAGPSDMARAANELTATACISLQIATAGSRAGGPVCAYFGSASTHSPAGKRLAELVLEELDRGPGSPGRLERLTDAILRDTRMPAVLIQPGATTAADVPRVALAVADALRRFFAG
jgi:N-acetylmuramoyl-L-alanine amidase